MLLSQDVFVKDSNEGLAICGIHLKKDAIHVGLFWNSENEKRIIHFQNGDHIPVEDATDISFQEYLFNAIPDFPNALLPRLSAISELISENKLNGFIFNRIGVVYNGGKFEYKSGEYTTQTAAEKFVNCAVFVIALLKTFDYTLLDWNSWPNINPRNLAFLNTWLDESNIPYEQRELFYNQTKEVRGKHVLVCPSTQTRPSFYKEVQQLADRLIRLLNI